MSEYRIPTVFYWPVEWHLLAYSKGYMPLEYPDAVRISQDHEVGSHTITHRHLTNLTVPDAVYEIVQSKTMLEELFAQDVTKFCPPRGYTTDGLTAVTLEMYESQRLTRGENLVHIHPASGANAHRPWQDVLQEKLKLGIEVEIWGHTWELDRYDIWGELEEMLEALYR